jgi:hypothetical protein
MIEGRMVNRRLPVAVAALCLASFVGSCGGGGDEATPSTTAATAPPTTVAGLDSVFKPVAGYSFVELPDSVLQEMRDQFESNPEFGEVVVENAARSVTRSSEGIGIVMALRLDERYAALPGIERGIIQEFTQSSASTRTVATAGDEVTVSTDEEGTVFVVWVEGTLVLMIIGPEESTLIPVATSLITANR